MVKLWWCSKPHPCKRLAARTSMTCDECGATIRKKEGYLHCFTCGPTRLACYTCMRQLHGIVPPTDVQGDPCPELSQFFQDQQCHLSLGHEGMHACGGVQTCYGKTRKWYPEQVGTQREQLHAVEDVESGADGRSAPLRRRHRCLLPKVKVRLCRRR